MNFNQPAQSKIQAAQAKILLVDDNADMRDYIRRLLSGSYIVQTVADGVAALTAIKKNPPDLVLTDVMMPGMDGFELLRSLRSNPATQDIPIILLSARAGEESRIEGLEAGADDYLTKPFSARELLARVEASLKLARLRQEATVRERTLLGRVTDGFMAMDLDFRITYANEAAQRVSRTPLEAILGKTMWEAFPGTIGNQFEIQYRRSLSEQIAVDFEEYYAPFDLWVEVHVYPSPTGLSLFFRDINDRKKIEQERERFLAVGSDLQVITGINGYFHWVSPTFERILGWTPDEMTSRPWTEFVHPDDLGTSIAEADSLFSGNETFTFENRYRHKDGSYRWFLWNAQPYPEEQLIYGAAVDITPRKQTEEALRESEARFRQMTDSAPMLVWMSGIDTLCNYFNQTWLDFTGRIEQEFGNGWAEGVHPDDFQCWLDTYMAAFEARRPFEMDYRLRRFDGEYRWIVDAGVPRCTPEGEFLGYIGSCIDIHDRKQAEEAILERSRLSALSADIGTILIQNNTLPDTLKQCSEALVHHLDAAFARIWTLNREKKVLELQASAGMYTHLDGSHSQIPVGQFKIGLIAQERQPHFTNNVIGDPRVHDQEWAAREGIVAFAGYPLIVENQVVGVMGLFSRHWLFRDYYASNRITCRHTLFRHSAQAGCSRTRTTAATRTECTRSRRNRQPHQR